MNLEVKKNSIWKELFASLGGATITSGIQLLFILRTPGQKLSELGNREWVAFILSAIAGAVIGWAYRLATGLRKFTEEALGRLETATHFLEFQEEPLDWGSFFSRVIGKGKGQSKKRGQPPSIARLGQPA
jgi:hypothetical protein